MASAPPPPPSAGTAAPAAGPLAQSELYRNYNFLLRVDANEMHFTECIGLGMRIEPIRYRESGAHSEVRVLAGPLSYSEIILRYGVTDSLDLWSWLQNTAEGNILRKRVTIVQLGNDAVAQKITWNLHDAFPCQWSAVPWDSLGRETAVEELRLAFNRLERA